MNKSYNYQYSTFWNNLPKPDAVILRDINSPHSNDKTIGESDRRYKLGGGFFCNHPVSEGELEKEIIGETSLKSFEQAYDGKFFIPCIKPLFE